MSAGSRWRHLAVPRRSTAMGTCSFLRAFTQISGFEPPTH